MIRLINENDITECVRVIKTSFLTVAEAFGITPENAPRFTAFSTTEERLLAQLTQERRPMFVYISNDTVIGYYSLNRLDDRCCELNNLCVLPKFRNRGAGAELLAHSFSTAKKLGFSVIQIGIVEENTRLRTWYETFGFIHTGTKKFDFFPFTCGYMEKSLEE